MIGRTNAQVSCPTSKLFQVVDKTIENITKDDIYGAKVIGYYSFEECRNLVSFEIPETVQAIERHGLDGCSSLPTITIPKTVARIGDGAFANCTNLIQIRFEGLAPAFGSGVFNNTNPSLVIEVPTIEVEYYKNAIQEQEFKDKVVGY